MEEALRSILKNAAALTEIVAGRIDWGMRPQGATLPAIDLHLVSAVPQMTMTGPAGWSRDRVQIDCWGRTFRQARDAAKVIAGPGGLLLGFRGTAAGVQLRTFVVDGRNDTDSDNTGPLFRSSLDVTVWHNP